MHTNGKRPQHAALLIPVSIGHFCITLHVEGCLTGWGNLIIGLKVVWQSVAIEDCPEHHVMHVGFSCTLFARRDTRMESYTNIDH